jgi:subtilisin family serine protease
MHSVRRCLTTLLLAQSALSGQGRKPAPGPGEFLRDVSALPLPVLEPSAELRSEDADGKISSRLRRLLDGAAVSRSASSETALLPVVVRADAIASVPGIESEIRAHGGEVTTDFENVIWSRMPPASVAAIAASARVNGVMPQPVDLPVQTALPRSGRSAPFMSDGIRAARLQLLHQQGVTGKGVKVGILDLGFGGYTSLVREGRAKAARAQKAFPASYGVENREPHGSACAEIVSGAAPGTELYLASFDGRQGRMVEAALWLVSQGVQIISYSAVNAEGPNDGSDIISRFIDFTTRRYGVLWVVAAGNYAQQHWAGSSMELSADGLIETGGTGPRGLEITPAANRLRIVVRWDDWGPDPRTPSSTQDIDAYLLQRERGGQLRVVGQSTDRQNGGAALPLEIIEMSGRTIAGTPLLLVLKARRVTERFVVHVFLDSPGHLYPSTASGSIVNPASAHYALAVGAVDVMTGNLAPYSSQGPTDDHRLKPEVAGPANTVSWAYAGINGRFPGTSAAAPHVAALAALIKEMHPTKPASELRTTVMRTVAPRGSPRPNSLFGYGEIDAGTVETARTRSIGTIAGRSAADVAIPQEFGGSVSSSALDAFRAFAAETRDGLAVRIAAERDLYAIGDSIRIRTAATADCSCLIFLRDATGAYSLLPLGDSGGLRLKRGEIRLLPDGPDESWEVIGPAGSEELLLVCAAAPLPLTRAVEAGGAGAAVAGTSYQVLAAADSVKEEL